MICKQLSFNTNSGTHAHTHTYMGLYVQHTCVHEHKLIAIYINRKKIYIMKIQKSISLTFERRGIFFFFFWRLPERKKSVKRGQSSPKTTPTKINKTIIEKKQAYQTHIHKKAFTFSKQVQKKSFINYRKITLQTSWCTHYRFFSSAPPSKKKKKAVWKGKF